VVYVNDVVDDPGNALRISDPVQRRPMLVNRRTVTGDPPRDR